VRGVAVDRAGIAAYVHLIRGPQDPERSARPKGGRADRAPHLTLAEVALETCREQILGLLSDGEPRTFNCIGVTLLDHTADTLFESPYDDALWQLVSEGRLEHTLEAPVFFRVCATSASVDVGLIRFGGHLTKGVDGVHGGAEESDVRRVSSPRT
jgi:hypothetical protein